MASSNCIVAGLKSASEIFVLLFLAIFIASIFSALLSYFSSKGVPKNIWLFSILFIIIFTFGLLTYIVSYKRSILKYYHNEK